MWCLRRVAAFINVSWSSSSVRFNIMDGAGSLGPFRKCLIVSNYFDETLFRKKYDQAHSVMEAFPRGCIYRTWSKKPKSPCQVFNSPSSSSSGFPSISQQHRLYRWNKGDPGYILTISPWIKREKKRYTYHIRMENNLLDDVCGTGNEKIDTVLEIVVEICVLSN